MKKFRISEEWKKESVRKVLVSALSVLLLLVLAADFAVTKVAEQEEDKSAAEQTEVIPFVPLEEAVRIPAEDEWKLILVNRKNPVPADFTVELEEIHDGVMVDVRIADLVRQMSADAAKEGISLYPCSGYRSPERSQWLYDNQVQQYLDKGYAQEEAEQIASQWVALPGTSEHHTGLVVDFVSNDCTTLNESFAGCDAAKWLVEHAAEYGFTLRYFEGQEEITGVVFEPWHYRYVGKELAVYLMEREMTLEEFLGAEPVGYSDMEKRENAE